MLPKSNKELRTPNCVSIWSYGKLYNKLKSLTDEEFSIILHRCRNKDKKDIDLLKGIVKGDINVVCLQDITSVINMVRGTGYLDRKILSSAKTLMYDICYQAHSYDSPTVIYFRKEISSFVNNSFIKHEMMKASKSAACRLMLNCYKHEVPFITSMEFKAIRKWFRDRDIVCDALNYVYHNKISY